MFKRSYCGEHLVLNPTTLDIEIESKMSSKRIIISKSEFREIESDLNNYIFAAIDAATTKLREELTGSVDHFSTGFYEIRQEYLDILQDLSKKFKESLDKKDISELQKVWDKYLKVHYPGNYTDSDVTSESEMESSCEGEVTD